jgi:hypothetical protein
MAENSHDKERAAVFRMRRDERKKNEEKPDEQNAFRSRVRAEEASDYEELTDP